MLYQRGSHNGSNMGTRMHSYPLYQDLQQRAEPLAEVMCRRLAAASVSIDNQTERVEAEMVSGNFFSMLGVKPAIGRVFNSQEDDQHYQGHPVVVLSYGYWESRFARDPNVLGKKILVNDYPMTIVGVSQAGFAGIDPAQSPQIRVPIQMKPVIVPDWGWLHMDDRRARWVQVFGAAQAGLHRRNRERAAAGTVHADPHLRDDAAGGEGLVPLLARAVHEGTDAGRLRGDRLLGRPEQFLHGAARADVDGRPGAAHRLRERRQPADRPGVHAPEGNGGAALARRLARTAGRTDAGREHGAVVRRRRGRSRARGRADARAPGADAVARIVAAAHFREPRSADPRLHARTHVRDRHRLRPGAGAARQPSRSVDHAEGHGRIDRRDRRVAVPAQGTGRRAGRAELPAAVRRRAVRPQPAEPQDRRHRRGARQSGHVPAVAGSERLRRFARARSSMCSCSNGCARRRV